MAWRLLLKPLKNPNPRTSQIATVFTAPFSPDLLKSPHKKRKNNHSAGDFPVESTSKLNPHFEQIVQRDTHFRFLIRSKEYLAKKPEHVIKLDEAGKLYRELGFPRGKKVGKFIEKHPLLFEVYRHDKDGTMWFGFSDLMEELVEEERRVMEAMEKDRVWKVRKLLMMAAGKRIPLSKIYHTRLLFGIPEDFRDRVLRKYPEYFRLVVEEDGRRVLELVKWEEALAVSALERDFAEDENRVSRVFRFPVKRGRSLDLGIKRVTLCNMLPLVSPYSEGEKFDLWTLEAEKYRVGVLHEFLNLTLEKRASIHHIVEFKEEFSLTKHTYQMLWKQPRTFYLAGTEMNWTVFLKDAYNENGLLNIKDPQVIFNEKLYKYAEMKDLIPGSITEDADPGSCK